MVTITVEMTESEAMALAQFLKRVGFTDFRSNAVSEDEAYTMIDASEKIRKELAEVGFAPR
ncbi:MAG: hypothetical protein JRI32_06030 [Deltaproteobacteria bacterium]|nr:hypothetical protein [Deltaproteobacteria bacterium]